MIFAAATPPYWTRGIVDIGEMISNMISKISEPLPVKSHLTSDRDKESSSASEIRKVQDS